MFSILSRHPEPGDTVRLTANIPTGLVSPHAPAGSIGVVTGVSGGRVEIELDGGIVGATTIGARARECRVIDRGTGVERFRSRMRRRNAIRLGALILLALPLVQFMWQWWQAVGSFEGLIEYLPLALLESGIDFMILAFGDPIRAALTAVLGTVTCWLAFGRPRRP